MYVSLLTGLALFVTDFNVLPPQPDVQSETSVDGRSKVKVPYSKIGTASEKTVKYFVVGANYNEQQDGTISLKDMTESADTFPKVSSNLTYSSEVFRNMSLKLERMNKSVPQSTGQIRLRI
jgi:flagellar biosynthesis protein FliP